MAMDVQLPRPISRIVFRCSEETKTALLSKVQLHEGSTLTDELLEQARETAKAYNGWLAILVTHSMGHEEYLKSTPEIRRTFIPSAMDDGVKVVVWDRATPPERIRVHGGQHQSKLIEKIMPSHGGEELGVPAAVKLAVTVGKDGNVIEVEPLAGPDLLIAPAVDAVRQWRYQRTLLNGRPVEVETTVDVPFAVGK